VFWCNQLAATAANYPQTAYTGLIISLQAEGQHVCHVVLGVALALAPVELAIMETFLPALFSIHTSLAINDDFNCLLSPSVQ
ncbi:hypothetical protein ACHAXS_003793, partial [Conticribra weissflogii]